MLKHVLLAASALAVLTATAASAAPAVGLVNGNQLFDFDTATPSINSALRNITAHGTTGGLTGPVRRGDAVTVQRHLEALRGKPELVEIYRALARRAVEIAARLDGRDAPDRAGLDAIRALLQ